MGDRGWDPFKTFKLSEEERELIDRRRKTRDKFRAEYRKLYSDPRRPHILDHNFMRWYAYRNNQSALHQLTKKSVIGGFKYSIFPIIVAYNVLSYAFEKKEEDIMSGKLTWRQRVRGEGCLGAGF
ncbi:uncharacterized protein LOC134238979 [Saccostrea cucullata]|uniref:uncharacterized protein LOC134238979 n=1 Tax=Saccostrea cuccullata TaxID=36930 RepID=UPI002ED4E283